MIPVYKPKISANAKKYVNECIDSTWISSKGRFVSLFEQGFKDYLGVAAATSVSNGTVALHIALLALGIGEGDEVIVPTLTYVASVNAVRYVGAKPIFVDSDKESWNIDVQKVESLITNKTKAVMAVHLYGNPCEMHKLSQLCKKHGISLIEDAAEALGSMYAGQHMGLVGDIATFSFFGNKTLTTGEGGMIVSNHVALIEKAAHLKNQGVSMSREYWHDVVGYNYRMTNICAAIGCAQLEELDFILDKKKSIAGWYQAQLQDLPVTFQSVDEEASHSYWMVAVLFKTSEERDFVRHFLSSKQIETRPVFYPAHRLPMYYEEKAFSVADDLSGRGINLPSYPTLTKQDVVMICKQIKAACSIFERELAVY